MKRRVAFLFLGDFNFDARATNMVSSLISSGFYVDVFDNGKKTIPYSRSLNITNIKIISFGFFRYFEWFFALNKKIRGRSYFAVFALDLYSLPSACKTIRHTLVYDLRDVFTELYVFNRFSFKKTFWAFVESFCIKHVNKIIVTAPSDEKYMKNIYKNYQRLKYSVVYNFPKLYSSLDSNYLIRKLKINKNYKIVLYQGVLQEGRGIEYLIKIVEKTKNSIGVIVGEGPYKKNLIKKASALSKNIFFVGRVPYKQLLNITVSADVGCVLTVPVGINNCLSLPNKLFEYSACGVPVLASNVPNVVRYINKYSLGVVVKDLKNNALLLDAYNKVVKQKKKGVCSNKSLLWDYYEDSFVGFVKE